MKSLARATLVSAFALTLCVGAEGSVDSRPAPEARPLARQAVVVKQQAKLASAAVEPHPFVTQFFGPAQTQQKATKRGWLRRLIFFR